MKRNIFLWLFIFPFLKGVCQDVYKPLDHIQLGGYIGSRLSSSITNRILAQDIDRLVNVFKEENRTETRCWQSEFWGKWFTSAVLAYRYSNSPQLEKKIADAVSKLIKTQTADGYIGNYAENSRLKQWDIWGRKYCMLGLLDYYDLKKDLRALKAAKGIADNLISDLKNADGLIVTKGNYRGMAASSVLEPVVRLYVSTREKKYLDFALDIVRQWSLPEGPQLIEKSMVDVAKRFPRPAKWYSWEQGQKAYEMMSCYEGLLELYQVTGDVKFKQAVINTWENINATEINIAGSGASTEMWFGGTALQSLPIHHYQEVCVTVTWIRLSLQLFRLTGQAKYAAAAERSYYNALLGSLDKTGAKWAKYTPLNGQRLPGGEQCGMGINCCIASGPRALFLVPFYAVTQHHNSLMVNYFMDGKYETLLNGSKIMIRQHTSYPVDGNIQIHLDLTKPTVFDLKIRIPEWAENYNIQVNGIGIVQKAKAGSYYTLRRQWRNGDSISLSLVLRGRLASIESPYKSVAVLWGPIVLSRDAMFGNLTPMGAVLKPVIGKTGYMDLTPITGDSDIWMKFKGRFVPESYSEGNPPAVDIMLCDYASAGNIEPLSLFQTWFPQLINKSE